MRRLSRRTIVMAMLAAAAGLAGARLAAWRGHPKIEECALLPRAPRISPDYTGIVVPPNIAPLNFSIREKGRRFFVSIRSETGDAIEIVSDSPQITIATGRWRPLLGANRGKDLLLDVCAEVENGWERYQTIVNHIAEDDIDQWIVYRAIGPIFTSWRATSVRQRDLSASEESFVVDGLSHGERCVNCHTFAANAPDPMLLGFRAGPNSGTLHVRDGNVEKLKIMFGFSAWHPSGRMAVYATSRVEQFYHQAGVDTRDAIDWDDDLAYYDVGAHQAKMVPCGTKGRRVNTYPAWSPDGRYLYYSSAPILWNDRSSVPPPRYAEVKSDLMRIRYDIDSDRWGTPETVLSAGQTGLSAMMPRISPDGKFLLFCMCRYGLFPTFARDSDLYLMDLAKGTYTKPEINSECSESWHSWSSNSRWIAFSSKRGGGILTQCYLSYLDPAGRAHKPFILPQRDPKFYDSALTMVNLPELITAPVPVSHKVLERRVRSGDAVPVDAPSKAGREEGRADWHAIGG